MHPVATVRLVDVVWIIDVFFFSKYYCVLQILQLVDGLTFTGKSAWKPIQSGLKLSTKSVLDLYNELVTNGDYKFLLTSRLSQDALETLNLNCNV